MKYMVMECHLSYAVVLDEDGNFLKAANLHYQVGQTISDIVEMRQPDTQRTKKKGYRWIYSLAAAAACLIIALTTVFQLGGMTYGSVYLTINPEVRIDVNRNDMVVGLEGTNEDGEMLVREYSYRKKELELVMDELVDRAIEMGYLHEGGQITLTLDADDNEWVASHSDSLTGRLNEHLADKVKVTIRVTDTEAEGSQVIIPVAPGESDNANSSSEDSPAAGSHPDQEKPSLPAGGPAATPPSSSYGDSDYGETDDDNKPAGSGQTGNTPSEPIRQTQSDYDPPGDDDSEEGDSPYDHNHPDNDDSKEDDDTDKNQSAENDSQYDAPDSEQSVTGDSGYNDSGSEQTERSDSEYDDPDANRPEENDSGYDDSDEEQTDENDSGYNDVN